MNLLSIVIVNYRSGDLLRACLDSILKSLATQDFEILVANNDSVGDLSQVLARDWPNTRIIQNTSNLGFGAAANRAFRQSKGKFLLLLNPDVAGMVLPQLRNPDGSLQYSCRRFYTCGTLLLRRGPWKRFFDRHPKVRWHLMADWDHQSLAAVDWGLGAAALVRREALQGAELFDERFFLYFEDVDLCLRLRLSGWQVLYDPASIMVHEHRRDSAGPWSLLAKRHHSLSLLKFLWKYRFQLGPRPLTGSVS
jgi:N-acetylglucosaminyl-diphospho-decaprenol L-rhamnosyltransferase